VVAGKAPVERLGIREIPRSGRPEELMKAHGITAEAVVEAVKRLA
jgi:transketolase